MKRLRRIMAVAVLLALGSVMTGCYYYGPHDRGYHRGEYERDRGYHQDRDRRDRDHERDRDRERDRDHRD